MTNVNCRPQLHGATTSEQYAQFHAGMEGLGFERTITRNGKTEHLPNGEYLALNLSTPFNLLALKIDALARQITGNPCKVTLWPVVDLAAVYTYGLEEDNSFGAQLGQLMGGYLANPAASPYGSLTGFKR